MSKYCYTVMALLLLASFACRHTQPEQVSFGPETKANLVVLLKRNVNDRDVNEFLEKELIVGSLKTHFRLKNGIASLVKATTQGHRGFAITFQPYATTEERQTIKKDLTSSPFVYRVFEDIAPINIKFKENV